MQCGVCERDRSKLQCVQCIQTNLWKLRTEYLDVVSKRDAASDKIEEYLEGHPVALLASARRGELQERIRIAQEESQKLREVNRHSMSPFPSSTAYNGPH